MSTLDENDCPGNFVDFLQVFEPGGPWCLSYIVPDEPPVTQTFQEKDLEAMTEWVNKYIETANLHFHVNPVGAYLTKKATATKIKRVTHFHVDLDPPKSADIDLKAEQDKILHMLQHECRKRGVPWPSFIVFSGNGYQAFWTLETPIEMDGSQAMADEIKLYNKWLEQAFNGDGCHNIDRLMRAPFTWNIPNKRKRELGRVRVESRLVGCNPDLIYPLEAFKKAEPEKAEAADGPVEKIEGKRVEDLDDLPVSDRVKRVIAHGKDPDGPPLKTGNDSWSDWLWYALCEMARAGVEPEVAKGVITDPTWGVSKHVLESDAPDGYADRQIARAFAKAGKKMVVLDKEVPWNNAEKFVTFDRPNIFHMDQEWYDFDGRAYRKMPEDILRAKVASWVLTCFQNVGDAEAPQFVPITPNGSWVNGIVSNLKLQVIRETTPMPFWRGDGPDPKNLIVLANGILDTATGELLSHTPDLVSTNYIDVEYDPDATCPMFLEAMGEWWPDLPDEIATWQEWWGLNLVCDTSYHKSVIWKGPPRAGKGISAKLMTDTIGRANVCRPTLTSMGERFGLEPFIGKLAAIIGDARQDHSSSRLLLTERMLGIIGGDPQDVDRKGIPALTDVDLHARVTIFSNELPTFSDATGVVASRFIPLIQPPEASHLGREDLGLLDRLVTERSGILNWALVGLRRLRANGRFTMPARSRAAIAEMTRTGSSFNSWWNECVEVEPGATVRKEMLYPTYAKWCVKNGYRPEASGKFWAHIKDKPGIVERKRKLGGGMRVREIEGIEVDLSILTQADNDDDDPAGMTFGRGSGSGPGRSE